MLLYKVVVCGKKCRGVGGLWPQWCTHQPDHLVVWIAISPVLVLASPRARSHHSVQLASACLDVCENAHGGAMPIPLVSLSGEHLLNRYLAPTIT